MKWIKNIPSYLLQETLIAGFNFLIITKLLSDENVENVVKKTVERSIFKPAILLVDIMEKESKKDNFDQLDKTEKNKLLKTYKNYTVVLVTEFCLKTIWNKTLARKVSDRILKEFFRKLSWQFRSIGLEFSSEVPSI